MPGQIVSELPRESQAKPVVSYTPVQIVSELPEESKAKPGVSYTPGQRHAISEVFSNPVDRVNQQSSAREKLRATMQSPRAKLRATMQSPGAKLRATMQSPCEKLRSTMQSPREKLRATKLNKELSSIFQKPVKTIPILKSRGLSELLEEIKSKACVIYA